MTASHETTTFDQNLELEGTSEYLQQKEQVIFGMIEEGIREVERRYDPDGETPKPYHNGNHTREVIDAATLLCDRAIVNGRLQPGDKNLVILAACYHDVEQNLGPGENEKASADMIGQKMYQSGVFTEEEIGKVRKMVLATTFSIVDGHAKQEVDEDDILTLLMADADLSSLGRSQRTYWNRAMLLLEEITGNPDPTAGAIVGFAQEQIGFLKNHDFHTEEAATLFPYKVANMHFSRWMAAHYQKLPADIPWSQAATPS